MNKFNPFVFLFFFGLLLSSNLQAQKKTKDEKLVIKTMLNCEVCEEELEDAFSDVDGIKTYEFDLDFHKIIIKYNPLITTPERLREAISDAGFPADDIPASEGAYELLPDCCKKVEDQEGDRAIELDEKSIELKDN